VPLSPPPCFISCVRELFHSSYAHSGWHRRITAHVAAADAALLAAGTALHTELCSPPLLLDPLHALHVTNALLVSADQRDPGPDALFSAAPEPSARYPLVLGADGRPALGTWNSASKIRAAVTEVMKTRTARALAPQKLILDAVLGQIALAVAMVMAGTGDLATLQVRVGKGWGLMRSRRDACGKDFRRGVHVENVAAAPLQCARPASLYTCFELIEPPCTLPCSFCAMRPVVLTWTCTTVSRQRWHPPLACSSSPQETRR
jgi:hypothetical protein